MYIYLFIGFNYAVNYNVTRQNNGVEILCDKAYAEQVRILDDHLFVIIFEMVFRIKDMVGISWGIIIKIQLNERRDSL